MEQKNKKKTSYGIINILQIERKEHFVSHQISSIGRIFYPRTYFGRIKYRLELNLYDTCTCFIGLPFESHWLNLVFHALILPSLPVVRF